MVQVIYGRLIRQAKALCHRCLIQKVVTILQVMAIMVMDSVESLILDNNKYMECHHTGGLSPLCDSSKKTSITVTRKLLKDTVISVTLEK